MLGVIGVAEVRVRCLGGFECIVGGRPVASWGAGKSRSLLQFLLVHEQRWVTRAQVHAALWPSARPESAANSLKVAVHALRRVLRPSEGGSDPGRPNPVSLQRAGTSYRLTGDIWADCLELNGLAEKSRAATRRIDLVDAVACSEKAQRLYLGEFLPEEDTDWADEYREWLRAETLGMHDGALRLALRSEDYTAAHALALASLTVDPCHEPAFQTLIWVCGQRGQRSQAHEWFERCRRRLAKQLEVAPDPLTVRFHQNAVEGEPTGSAPERLTRP